MFCIQRPSERLLVHEAAPGDVDQVGAGLHGGQQVGVDHAFGDRRERGAHHDMGGVGVVRTIDGVEKRGFKLYVGGGLGAATTIGAAPVGAFQRDVLAPALQVDAHLLDFNGELYGKAMELELVERLRDEQRFGSTDELAIQISRDIERARTLF